MIMTKCGYLPDKIFYNYLDRLIGRFYKILALKEENCSTLNVYIESFQRELIGSKNLIVVLNDDNRFLSLISILQFFLDNEYDDAVCKTEVMKAIDISKKLKKQYFEEEVL